MLVIRLQRTGRQNLASYRIVVAEKSKAVKKEVVEILGFYLPTQNPKVVNLDMSKIQDWIKKGAQPSETVASLLIQEGMKEASKYLSKPNKKATKKKASSQATA